ncbi:hypothetical protein B0T10DRAFT_549696 [Thelonectria olida]|uniref:ShKT domain-containing protein n=1 Tax=Thelonectria olida TaxID=1576542 RepID=A0A9P9ANZ6_9HYPO|nr:hypothetical protein B0T10DRAFT_549696 [Thelonectria olida]
MHFLKHIPLFAFLTLTHAIPQLPRNLPTIQPQPTSPPLSAIAVTTTPPSVTDYRTMSPGTYTITRTDGSVLIIVVTAVQKITTMKHPSRTETTASPTPLPPCPSECDCSWIKDKESQEYVMYPYCLSYCDAFGLQK